jgi:hypothetical protein
VTSSNDEMTVGGMSPIGGSRSAETISARRPPGVSKSICMPSTRLPVRADRNAGASSRVSGVSVPG